VWSATVAALVGLVAMYIARGRLSGQRRFGAYSAQLGIEGVVRVAACLLLATLAVRSLWPWMIVVSVALVVAVVATSGRGATADDGPGLPLRELGTSIGAVMVCTVISQSLVNFGPVAVRLLSGPSEQALAGRLLAAALLARLPIFAFAAVQAVLVPHLVGAVVRGDRQAFARSLNRVLVPTIALGGLGVLVCATVGPFVLGVLGPDYQVPRRDLVLLALSVALFLGTLVLQPAAISLRMHWAAALAWGVSALVFVGLCLLPVGPLLAVEVALMASSACALVLLLLVTRRGLPGLSPVPGATGTHPR
jgi:O-antigen/teichoic acid export membrane protein